MTACFEWDLGKANQQSLRSARAPSCGPRKSLLKLEAPAPGGPPFGEFVMKSLSFREGVVPSLPHPHRWNNPHFKLCFVAPGTPFYKLSCDNECLPFALVSLHSTKYTHTLFRLAQELWKCGIIILFQVWSQQETNKPQSPGTKQGSFHLTPTLLALPHLQSCSSFSQDKILSNFSKSQVTVPKSLFSKLLWNIYNCKIKTIILALKPDVSNS